MYAKDARKFADRHNGLKSLKDLFDKIQGLSHEGIYCTEVNYLTENQIALLIDYEYDVTKAKAKGFSKGYLISWRNVV